MYLRDSISYTTKDLDRFNTSTQVIESLWVKIVNCKHRQIIVGTIYRPPTGNVHEFVDILTEQVNEISGGTNMDIFILGDFNVNYSNIASHDRKHLKDFEMNTSLKQIITQPTRYNNTIDLVYTNSDCVEKSGVWNINVSDHNLVYVCHKKQRERFKMISFFGRSYRQYSNETFQEQLRRVDWGAFYKFTDPDHCWDFIESKINNLIGEMCPLKHRTIKDKGDPWITNEIIELLHDKERAWKTAMDTQNPDDVAEAKRLRNLSKAAIRRSKRDFIQETANRTDGNGPKFWDKMNYILPKKRNCSTINLIDKISEEPVEHEKRADLINSYFSTIGNKLAEKFSLPWIYEGLETDKQMENIMTSTEEVERICKNIVIYKASSVPYLSSRVLKDGFLAIIPQLTHMFNISLGKGIFPEKWKLATVIPNR